MWGRDVPPWDLGGGHTAYQTLKRPDWYLQDKHASHAYNHVTLIFVLFWFSFIYCSTRDRTQGLAHARRVLDH